VKKLKAIFFDIDDTLFSTSQFAESARRAAVDAMRAAGLRIDAETCMRELQEVLEEFTSNYPSHFDKVIQRLPAEASAGLNHAVLVAAGVVAYHETKWRHFRVYDDAWEVLNWLASTDLIRGIISAGLSVKQAEKIIRLNIRDFLTPNAIYFTEQVGISKPNPKLYQRVVADQGLEPGAVMYVGDSPIHDIDPANQVGMLTVRCQRGGRWAGHQGKTAPDYVITDFHQLRKLLEEEFGVTGAGAGGQARPT
jgi:putative hydrolase of the HAD superfamily